MRPATWIYPGYMLAVTPIFVALRMHGVEFIDSVLLISPIAFLCALMTSRLEQVSERHDRR